MVLIGPSGCGKSTFLRCLNLLEEPSAGTLQVGERTIEFGAGEAMPHGRDLARFRARIGMVFQQFDLFPHMTALRNVMRAPVIVKKMAQARGRGDRPRALAKVGLGAITDALSARAVGRPAAACRHRPRHGDGAEVMLFDEVPRRSIPSWWARCSTS